MCFLCYAPALRISSPAAAGHVINTHKDTNTAHTLAPPYHIRDHKLCTSVNVSTNSFLNLELDWFSLCCYRKCNLLWGSKRILSHLNSGGGTLPRILEWGQRPCGAGGAAVAVLLVRLRQALAQCAGGLPKLMSVVCNRSSVFNPVRGRNCSIELTTLMFWEGRRKKGPYSFFAVK